MSSTTTTIPPPSSPIRLAILEADTPPAGTHARYNGYRGVFTHLFTRALASPSQEPLSSYLTITAHDVVNISPSDPYANYPSLSEIDAILITGSKHSAFENDPWILTLTEFVKKAITKGDAENGGRTIKVIGVCFGHQIVGQALGQTVERNERGWEISVTRVGLTEAGRGIFKGREDLVSLFSFSFNFSFILHKRKGVPILTDVVNRKFNKCIVITLWACQRVRNSLLLRTSARIRGSLSPGKC